MSTPDPISPPVWSEPGASGRRWTRQKVLLTIWILASSQPKKNGCFQKWWVETPQIILFLIGFSIIFAINQKKNAIGCNCEQLEGFIKGLPEHLVFFGAWNSKGSQCFFSHKGVSKNNGIPKSSILIGFSIIFAIHFGVPLIFGNTQMDAQDASDVSGAAWDA